MGGGSDAVHGDVRNALRWFMVNGGERTAETMDEYFAISVEWYGGVGGELLQELGENI